jgi:nicotinate-nucleotide--dimethylbenzimidazole phosphoribosyltransferase
MTHWYNTLCPSPCSHSRAAAQERQAQLTKPAGSLGRLEDTAINFAAWQATDRPTLDQIMVRVFAADHGICAQNISAFPQAVTAQMVANFVNGGAAICVLSDVAAADFAVVTMGLATALPPLSSGRLIRHDIDSGTADFSVAPAMTEAQMQQALQTGQQVLESYRQQQPDVQLFVGGEMGIGNTTSAAAVFSSLLDISPVQACGPGTGLSDEGVAHKAQVVERALATHELQCASAEVVLQHVGGFEIAALAGAYIAAAQQQVPSLVDGFITTAAALIAVRINPSCRDWLMFAHQSAEPAHRLALEALEAKPLIDLGLRLGEGSGAAVALPVIKSAIAVHNRMATFEEAAVAAKLA